MKPRAWLLSVVLLTLAPLAAQTKRLTLEETLGPVRYHTQVPPVTWATDGVHLAVRDRGQLQWVHPLTGAAKDPAADSRPAGRRRPPVPRAERREGSRSLEFESPDGKRVAFVQDNDLWVEDLGKEARRLTQDGSPKLLNGILDWVYQEEVYGRGDFRAHWWSPDSEHIAFLQLDESGVKDFTYVDHVMPLEREKAVRAISMLYPKAGDPNPGVRLGIAKVGGGIVWVDLGKYPADLLIVRVAWTPDGRVLFQVQDRVQRMLDLNLADPATGKVETLVHETSESWVNVLGQPRWLGDGSFLWLSERTGFKHVYHYEADGKLRATVTSGDWEVREVLEVDEAKKRVFFSATKDGATGNHAYRVDLDGKNLVRLTRDDGTHRVQLNGDRSLLIDTFSNVSTPPEQRLVNDAGEVVKVLGKSQAADLEALGYSRPELHKIPARDGYEMDALWIKPVPFDPAKKHPVWIETYAGPDAPSVRDAWSPSAWFQFLAQQGVVVFQVNNRSASGKGQKYTSACYRSFGKSELMDLEDAIDWLGKNPWVDTRRVGISGWSYGGTMAAYALTHSQKFRLGIAGAGVYDWRLYDTIYTERYMDLPQSNAAGYRESSVIESAAKLHGHLVMLHGTLDDNVHLQNAIHLTYALQMAGKDQFELMLYPKSEHGVRSSEQRAHMRRLIWRAICAHLSPGASG